MKRTNRGAVVVVLGSVACASALMLAGCDRGPPEPEGTATRAADPTPTPRPSVTPTPTPVAAPTPAPTVQPCVASGIPTATVAPAADDPLAGKWTLDDALKGLPGTGALLATLETDKGPLQCRLYDDKAPITVANFVGLARGLRPWKTPGGKWAKKPAYDGTPFHRIIKGFMIQGGDPLGTGQGDPGYNIPDEIWPGAKHDRPGLLCMANHGKNTNGIQFFITDGAPSHLDCGYTIFGECGPVGLVSEIASGPKMGDKATQPVVVKKVTISREPAAKAK